MVIAAPALPASADSRKAATSDSSCDIPASLPFVVTADAGNWPGKYRRPKSGSDKVNESSRDALLRKRRTVPSEQEGGPQLGSRRGKPTRIVMVPPPL